MIVGLRNPDSMPKLDGADGKNFMVVKISSESETDAKDAVQVLRQKGVERLDIVGHCADNDVTIVCRPQHEEDLLTQRNSGNRQRGC